MEETLPVPDKVAQRRELVNIVANFLSANGDEPLLDSWGLMLSEPAERLALILKRSSF